MKFTLEIELGNDAMQTTADISAALQNVARNVAYAVASHGESGSIMDENGNRVGRWQVSE